LCVYVGRISNEKRIHIIREAIAELDHVYLALIGDGPTAPVWAKLHSKENKIYCRPKFLSHSDLAECYASSDLHVSASEFETLGNTVLEAQASKIPVVVPLTQGFRDTVTTADKKISVNDFSNYSDTDADAPGGVRVKTTVKRQDGYLFTAGDAASAREYIRTLKEDAALRKRLGENGRENVKDLSCKNVVLEMLDWYRQGMRNMKARTLLSKLILLVPLLAAIPFCIVALFCYDAVTSVMVNLIGMKLDLGANDDKIKTKKE
jgi:glycosyltransferase involved in cell wall biosynthesis